MKEASVRAGPDKNHTQFLGEAVRALPPGWQQGTWHPYLPPACLKSRL